MNKRRWIAAFLIILALSHISCGWKDYEYPPGRVDENRLAEALASREQENPPPLTMLQAYQIAQERATEWSDDSYLVYMAGNISEDEPYHYNFRTPNKWGWSCIGGPAYTDMDIRVDPSNGEITRFQEIGQPELFLGYIDPNAWTVDSPRALEIAEASGGKSFWDRHTGSSDPSIIGYETFNGWLVVYASGNPEDGEKVLNSRFEVEIDPYTGSTRIVEDTDGVSGQKVIPGE
ncbi:MAG: hypothetical protein C4536_00925 [Actinobacteria bacterium]|jgi:hypothetical protein|nr:MAG: hypothetical protein C4536_00925 [Actinomycetota bacterium]